MSYELAKAYVQIIPTTKGITGDLEDALDGAGDSAGEKAGSSFSGKFGKALGTVGKVAGTALAGAVTGMTAFTKASVETGMSFDSSMSQVAATMGTTVDQIGNLRDFAMEMGATTAFSATEAADALNYMALAGYDADTSMAMLPNVLNLAAAGGIDLASASDMVTDAQSALGLSIDETTTMVDQMAKTSSKSNTSVEQLGDAFLKIGATARNLSGGTQELSTMLGVLADNGIKGAEGGTHLRNILLSLQSAAEDGTVDFGDFSVSVYDSEGNMRSMIDIVADMQAGMGDMSQEAKDAMISGVFNKTDLASVNALLNTSQTRFTELTDAIGDASGAAQDMADTQLDNLSGDITLLQSAFEGLQIAISDSATPSIRDCVQGLTDIVGGFQDLVNGVEGGSGKIKQGFEKILGGITDGIPMVLDVFESLAGAVVDMLPELLGSIVDQLPGLFDNILSAVEGLIPNLVNILPDLISTCVTLFTNLIGHMSEIITPIVKALPTIVKSLGSALVDNLPSLLEGVTSLITELAASLPDICTEIVDYIPELMAGILEAVVTATPKILEATGDMVNKIVAHFLGLETAKEQTERIFGEIETSVSDYRKSIEDAFNQEIDITGMFSSQGNTSAELTAEIDSIESQITEILKSNFDAQEEDRQANLENIRAYQEQLAQLEGEKLSIYEDQMGAQLTIMQNMTGASELEYMERLGTVKAYHDEAVAVADQAYETDILNANNYLQSIGGVEDAAYLQMITDAEASHSARIAELDGFYNQAEAIVVGSNDAQYSSTAAAFSNMSNAIATWSQSSGAKFAEFGSFLPVVQTEMSNAFAGMMGTLSEADISAANSMLNMAASMKAGGKDVESSVADNIDTILDYYEELPDSMQSAGGDSLTGLIQGMEDYFPELGNTSDMTAKEIVDSIRSTLGIHSPSTVMKEVGSNIGLGLSSGINAQNGAVTSAASSLSRSAVNAADGYYMSMYYVGYNLAVGIADGLAGNSYLISNAARNAVNAAVNAAKAAGQIQSPSKVMRDEVGKMLAAGQAEGILDGESMVVDAITDVNNGMMAAAQTDMAYNSALQATSSWIDSYRPDGSAGYGNNVTMNIYGAEGQDVRELAQMIIDELQSIGNREVRAFA